MSTTLDDVKALAEWARSQGLRRVKAGDIELEFASPSDPLDVAAAKKLTDQFMADVPTDEDMLNWSSWQPVRPGGGGDGEA